MLNIVSSCNLVQYQGKLMIQPWENGKNLNFGPNLGHNFFFNGLYLLVNIVMNQTWKNDKKKLILAYPSQFLFMGFTLLVDRHCHRSCHPMQIKGKLMNKTWENI